jgi:hypothetical protein
MDPYDCQRMGGQSQWNSTCFDIECPRQDKWWQPPVRTDPENVYYGWNQKSDWWNGPVVADDWVCSTPDPVSHIRWWGSFENWHTGNLPPDAPTHFHIQFWTNVPASPIHPFAHPGQVLDEVICWNFTWEFVGWDFDPRNGTYEACFKFEQALRPDEYFYQDLQVGIYWISIAACAGGGAWEHPFGWKTRPQIGGPVPTADAVVVTQPIQPHPGSWFADGYPLWWPEPTDSWDMAFELLTSGPLQIKYWQPAELGEFGLDVDSTIMPLADDFPCTQAGPLRQISIEGAWAFDLLPNGDPSNVAFDLRLREDAGGVPGAVICAHHFSPYQFDVQPYSLFMPADYWQVPHFYMPDADFTGWTYTFTLDPNDCFWQWGTPGEPRTYWLEVQATPGDPQAFFAWKTSNAHWGAGAYNAYGNLVYPPQHPLQGQQIDMAFSIVGDFGLVWPKWSQPPQSYTPSDAYNAWDEDSMFGPAVMEAQVAADDWRCTRNEPVSGFVWWGSWGAYGTQPWQLPESFHLTIWTDVPADPEDPNSFSHPGIVIWEKVTTTYTWEFVGWEFPPAMVFPPPPPVAMFKFTVDLGASEYFWQGAGEHIYWLCVAADYGGLIVEPYHPWGWTTRLRDPSSSAPDAAVVITDPTAPIMGSVFVAGRPIGFPWPWQPWDLAFELKTVPVPPSDAVVCEPQGVVNNPFHPPTYWYDVTPGWDHRCDFHVRVYDPNPADYTNVVMPPTWEFLVHEVQPGEWWASWWDADCSHPVVATFRFQFDNPSPSVWDHWRTTMGGLSDPYLAVMDQSENHSMEPDGYGYRVHVPQRLGDRVVCEPQGVVNNPYHPPTYWYDVATDMGARCDFHVRVYDPDPNRYTNVISPPTWQFTVHQAGMIANEWWASWWDPDCSHPVTVFRFQFDNPSVSTWGQWSTTESSSPDPYAGVIDRSENHATEPDGYGYRVHAPLGDYVKCRRPPTPSPDYPDYFYGWNEPSLYYGTQVVADDFLCNDGRPISDIHWWGSYQHWLQPIPPYPAPCCFHIGLWTDVPAGPAWSHPGEMIWEWWAMREQLNERPVGVDFHPDYGLETCFAYDFYIPLEQWFWQPDTNAVYWVSIAAGYDMPPPPDQVWGWKTRQPRWNDAAVRIFEPLPPYLGAQFIRGEPIENAEGPWDMAFVITSALPPVLCRGDLDCDDIIGFDDINPFVLAISSPDGYANAFPCCPWENGDCNRDGYVDFDDINAFVFYLSSGVLCPNP